MDVLNHLFNPRTVAIIGASSDRKKLGGRPVHFLKSFGYRGKVFPVNPAATEIQGLKSYPSVCDIDEDVDQALILLAAPLVEQALRDCARKGVRLVQVLSSGFAESGPEGEAAQARLVEIAKNAGMRLNGPNSLGCISPSSGYYATFSTSMAGGVPPPSGGVSIVTQSGAFGSCAYVMAWQRGIGLARVVATGNEADIDVAEVIAMLVQDDKTQVICAALEGCRTGDRLRAALTSAARAGKPVVMMKVGTTDAGAAAAATHTGVLAGNDTAYETVMSEGGAWRARSIEEMIDIAYLVSVGSMPRNDSVSLVSISGGIGILMADAAVQAGLRVEPLPAATHAKVKEIIPFACGSNPLDVTANLASRYSALSEVGAEILAGDTYGTLIFYLANNGLVPSVFLPTQEQLIALKKRFPDRVVIAVMPSEAGVRRSLEQAGIPVFEDPTRAVTSVAAAAAFNARWAAVEPRHPVETRSLNLPRPINEAAAKALLEEAGVPVVPERVCRTADEATAAAAEIGYPVVAKILSSDIQHKTEIGGVILDLRSSEQVVDAFNQLMKRATKLAPCARIDGVLIAPLLKGGVETILGIHRDPVFGPMVMFGLGGTTVELFKDVGFASAPLSRARAERLVARVKGARLLDGWRGSPPLDRSALLDAICNLSQLAVRDPEILGIDINPFLVCEEGAVALDAAFTLSGEGADSTASTRMG